MQSVLEDPIAYWEERQATLDAWRSGGDRGLSAEENVEFYAVRLGRLIELIRRGCRRQRKLRILDAGSGRGYFTDALRRSGHHVTGIDASPSAVAEACRVYGPHFVESTLWGFRPHALFDVVICVDVLFHVLDDRLWRSALTAFGRYASAEALLIVTDVFPEAPYAPTPYMVHRPAREYDEVLAAADFHPVERMPYDFGSNPTEFAVYRRSP